MPWGFSFLGLSWYDCIRDIILWLTKSLTRPTTTARKKRGLDSLTLACVGGVKLERSDLKKYIIYVIPIAGSIGYLGYISMFGPLFGNETFEWLRAFFVLGFLFYLATIGYTFPYIIVGLFTLYLAYVHKVKSDGDWKHFLVAGVWNTLLALIYFATMNSGHTIMV